MDAALGYLGLQFIAVSLVWGLPESQVGAKIFALIAVFILGIAAIISVVRKDK